MCSISSHWSVNATELSYRSKADNKVIVIQYMRGYGYDGTAMHDTDSKELVDLKKDISLVKYSCPNTFVSRGKGGICLGGHGMGDMGKGEFGRGTWDGGHGMGA